MILKKHIFVHLLNDFSGSPKVLSQVIQSVHERGGELELFTGKSGAGFLSGLTENHHQYFYKRSRNRFITLLSYVFAQTVLFLKVLRYFNEDVVIYVNTMLPFGAALAGFVIRKPVIYHVHEISLTPLLLKRFLKSVIKLTANKVIYVSKAVRDSERFEDINDYVLYNVLSSSFVTKSMEQPLRANNEDFNVLMIASLKSYKGLEEYIEIAKILESNSRISFTLVINAVQKDVATYFKDKELAHNIEVLSSQSDVTPFYNKASLVLNLSRIDAWVETFGLTILEAMAFGIPVIVPPVGGPAEIVTDGIEGYLISSYETGTIAEKIESLSVDRVKWLRLSKNALRRSKDFKEEIFNKQLIEILNA